MEKILDALSVLETAKDKKVINKGINEVKTNHEPKMEGLPIIAKQKKKQCAGCDGICCTKPTKEKHGGHQHEH